jgi:hypothetical protein
MRIAGAGCVPGVSKGSGERTVVGNITEPTFFARKIYGLSICALFLLSFISAAFLVGCNDKKVSLEYDPGPDLTIVTVESDGGLPYPGDDLLPAFQLYGDGRFIKYQGDVNGRGIFVQGRMKETAIADLLRKTSDTGFFNLKDEYVNPDVYDATYRRITIDLAETKKTVTVWMTEDVPDFDAAYDLILDYPIGEVSDYVPEQGYLVVVKYPVLGNDDYQYLDPASDIFKLLPDVATLYRAAADRVAIAVDGTTSMQLKEYDNGQESRGLYILQPDAIVAMYPVYEPRIAEKP